MGRRHHSSRGIQDFTQPVSSSPTEPRLKGRLADEAWRTHWYSLYLLARSRGLGVEEAEDLTQAFFLELLRKDYLASYDSRKGTLPGFLYMAFGRFLTKTWRRQAALKRGNGQPCFSLSDELVHSRLLDEQADFLTPDKAYERACTMRILERAERKLKASARAGPNRDLILRLIPLVTQSASAGACQELSRQFNKSVDSIRVALTRLRKRYVTLLREEICRECGPDGEARSEVRHLIEVLTD